MEGQYRAVIRLERLLPAMEPGETRALEVPWPGLAGAARSTGTLAIAQGEGLSVTVAKHEGLGQIDATELKLPGVIAAYRHLAPPAPVSLQIARLVPELRAGVHQLVRLGTDEDLIAVALQLDVRKAGVFTVAFDVPAAWEPGDVNGLAVDDTRIGAAKDGWKRIELALRGRLLGSGSAVLRFRAPASIPRDARGVPAVEVPVVRLAGARQVRGSLAVAAPRSWALTAGQRSGLAGAEVEPLRREGGIAALARELKDDEDLPLAFTFLGSGTAQAAAPVLTVAAAPRARELALRQEDQITVAEGSLRRVTTWRGDVRYSALPALRVQAPTNLDERLTFKSPGLADRTAVERKDGITTWELRFQSPVLGAFAVTVEATVELPALAAGQPAKVEVPVLRPLDATRLTSAMAVAREGTLEVAVAATGLDAIPPADLPTGLQGQGVVAGFQGAAPAALTLTLTRHDLVQLADGAVALARYDATVGDDGVARVLGRLALGTRGRPWLELRLPDGAQLLEVAVGGKQGRPSRRADGAVVVPLGDAAARQVVAFVYEQRLPGPLGSTGTLALGLPRLGSAAGESGAGQRALPVEQVELWLHTPESLVATSWGGDLALQDAPTSLWHRIMNGAAPARNVHAAYGDEPGADGLTVPVPLVGQRQVLTRLGDGGAVQMGYWHRRWLDAAALLLAVGGVLAAWWSRGHGPRLGALALTAAVVWAAAAGPWLVPAVGLAIGVGLGLFIAGGIALVRSWKAWRSARAASLPPPVDPWIATAAPAVPAPAPGPAPAPAVPPTEPEAKP